ncbi:MAG: Uma2 family endonuclease [Anaerolineae bacterium]|jgi:Uma2 family endonuclease|nr:Uma2 family endonuclease [Anaerolineae bacterium]
MTLKTHPLMTLESFEAFLTLPENRDKQWELIDGRIVEKVPTEEHGLIAGNILFLLKLYVREHKQGRVGIEIRHQRPQDSVNSRQPDVSYYIDHTRAVVTKGAVSVYPDLAVEVKSPDDSYVALQDKAHFYLAQGTRMVWLVYPSKQAIEVLTADDVQWFTREDTLTGQDLLPGFSVLVAEIFQLDPSQ